MDFWHWFVTFLESEKRTLPMSATRAGFPACQVEHLLQVSQERSPLPRPTFDSANILIRIWFEDDGGLASLNLYWGFHGKDSLRRWGRCDIILTPDVQKEDHTCDGRSGSSPICSATNIQSTRRPVTIRKSPILISSTRSTSPDFCRSAIQSGMSPRCDNGVPSVWKQSRRLIG